MIERHSIEFSLSDLAQRSGVKFSAARKALARSVAPRGPEAVTC